MKLALSDRWVCPLQKCQKVGNCKTIPSGRKKFRRQGPSVGCFLALWLLIIWCQGRVRKKFAALRCVKE